MKIHSLLHAVLTATASLMLLTGCQHSDKQSPFSVMSFNIRMDTPSDSANSWQHRKNNVYQFISYYQPDLIGMQEVLPNQLNDLKANLPQYSFLGAGRDDGKEAGEHCSILYNPERFELVDYGNFSISEQPDTYGVKGWDAACNRITTWAILEDKGNGKRLAYFNLHLDHVGTTARREGTRLVLKKAQELAQGLPVVITGDFNCTPDDEPSQILEEAGMMNAQKTASIVYGPSWSYHGFGRVPLFSRSMIDYVYFGKGLEALRYRNIKDTSDQGYYSDHNPVMAELAWQ